MEPAPCSTLAAPCALLSAFCFLLSAFPQAGDPTVLGWATFALYLIASVCSLRASIIRRPFDHADSDPEQARVWRVLAVMLLLLGLNKELDLQTALTKLGRQLALAEDLYASRRVIQIIFLVSLLLVLGLVAGKFFKTLQKFARTHPLAGTGGALVATYVVIRAASIEHVDQLLGFDLEDVWALGLVELLGTILVIAGAIQTKKLKS